MASNGIFQPAIEDTTGRKVSKTEEELSRWFMIYYSSFYFFKSSSFLSDQFSIHSGPSRFLQHLRFKSL